MPDRAGGAPFGLAYGDALGARPPSWAERIEHADELRRYSAAWD